MPSAVPAPVPVRKPSIAMLVAVTALGPTALNILMPSMPGLETVFQTDYGTVQLTLSLYLGGLAVSQLFYGPLSDRYGRRPVLLAGLGLFAAGSLLGLAAPAVEILILGRVVQAVGGCAGMVLARAIVRDLYGRERAAGVLAYMTMAMVVAPMLAPLIGGLLDDAFGWRAGFALVAAAGGAVLAAAALRLPETLAEPQPIPGLAGMVASYVALLRAPAFSGYALQTAFSTAGFFAFLGGAPYVMIQVLGRPPSEYGLYFILGAAGYMAGNFLVGRLSTAVGIDRMIGVGTLLSWAAAMAMLGLGLAGVVTPMALFGPMAAFALGNGLSLPNGVAGAISVHPRIAGAASGLTGFLQMGLGAGGSVLAGHLIAGRQNHLPMAAVMAAAATLAVLASVATVRVNRRAAAAQVVG